MAAQHTSLWQHRRVPSPHFSNMHITGLIPPYDTSRAVTNPPVSRSFQPTTTHMDMTMPLFASNPMTTTVPYQSAVYAFDSLPVNSYNIPQSASFYSPNMAHSVSYPSVSQEQRPPPIPETPNTYAVERNSLIKSERASPVQPSHSFDHSYTADVKRSSSEPSDDSRASFTTEVDTLMKAIQAKQTNAPQRATQQVCAVTDEGKSKCSCRQEPEIQVTSATPKLKKKYECTMPDCGKSFCQKTHLEIHIRAHTGAKPFVSTTRALINVHVVLIEADVQLARLWTVILSARKPQGPFVT